VAQLRVVADRLVQRDGGAAQLAQARDLLRLPLQRARQLVEGRLAAELGGEPALLAVEPPDVLAGLDGQPDHAALVADGAADRLADPDRRVGGEAVAAAGVELLHGADQANGALLDEVGERHAVLLALVALGHVDDEPEVGLHHPVLRREVAALHAPGQAQLLDRRQQRRAGDPGEEAGEALVGGLVMA
jgi:hypothetical protein